MSSMFLQPTRRLASCHRPLRTRRLFCHPPDKNSSFAHAKPEDLLPYQQNAVALFRRIAEGYYTLGLAHEKHGIQDTHERGVDDYKIAMEHYLNAAEKGHTLVCYNIGSLYERGLGVEKDLEKAFEWTQRAAEAGHSVAQHQLGQYYQNGTGVAKDIKLARQFFELAAAQGNQDATEELSSLKKI